jgi:glycerol kinase
VLILAIDQSTSGTKAIVFSPDGEVLAKSFIEHKQIETKEGWIEHDPDEICKNVIAACESAASGQTIDAIGISNQRETSLCWSRKTGKPFYNAIVWQCGRAAPITERLSDHADTVKKICGLPLSPYFCAAKFKWFLDNVPEAREAAKSNDLCLGTIDSWLVFKLSGSHKTDLSNASRTQLLSLDTLQWDPWLCELFGVPINALPEICQSDDFFGNAEINKHSIPIRACLGDSHAALYASSFFESAAKATLGTGASVMANIGPERAKNVTSGIAECLAWSISNQPAYALEGNINYAGAIIKWLVEDIGLLGSSSQSGKIADSVESSNGVYLVPAFSGLGAPHFNHNARAAFVGMNRTTKKAHLVRAAEEAIGYQIKDIVDEMAKSGLTLQSLSLDGGAAGDPFLAQFISDILGIEANASTLGELSAAGVAALAARTQFSFSRKRYTPEIDSQKRAALFEGWKIAIKMITNQ